MRTIQSKLIIAFTLLFLISGKIEAQELELIKDLEGYWQFSVGDNSHWMKKDFNDSKWDRLYVPKSWEQQGYDGYNGFAWYRKSFKLSSLEATKPVFLVLGNIDDVDEVYINGNKIGQTGSFFPKYKTAYNQERIYRVHNSLLKADESNVIAVRVYDSWAYGGITQGTVGLYYDITNDLLEINLEGEWSFALSKPSNNINPKLSSLDWTKIKVPGKWEDAGFEDYDGYAVYMKTFTISSKVAKNELVLVLGKIDDYDYVYFNGKKIGDIFELKDRGAYFGRGNEYTALRAYSIPSDLIRKDGKNTVVVKVYDYFQDGGIYEGPIGVTTKEKFKYFEKKYYGNYSIWDLIFN
ncbi:MAG: glycoside hydrolase [Marinilabiliales bacterium]|nr:MAG: glycoside hydrolase [Marinilabiliales bacterium]